MDRLTLMPGIRALIRTAARRAVHRPHGYAVYTTHLGFDVNTSAAPAFADVVRGPLRLLLSGPASSGARATPADAAVPGRNRIHLIVDDLDTAIDRLRGAGLSFRSDPVSGPRWAADPARRPAGNLIELFQPAR